MGWRALVVGRRLPIGWLAAVIGYLPIGIERLVHTALGPWSRRWPVIPALLVGLTLLTLIPIGQAAVELIVHPATVGELVDRRVSLSTRVVAVDGLALLAPFPALPPPDPSATDDRATYRWYAVRESLQDPRLVLVRSRLVPEALETRTVVAVIVDDSAAVSAAYAAIAARHAIEPVSGLAPQLLTEIDPGGRTVHDIGSVTDLGGWSVGDVVRIRLRVGDGIASCVPRGDCQARRLGHGIGTWDNLANDAAGGWVMLRTTYPPSVAPFHGVGYHAQDLELVAGFLAEPAVRGLLGWAHVLQTAHVEHDLSLPVDRLWTGPILFASVVGLVLIGLRLGYPRFSVGGRAGRKVMTGVLPTAGLACRATGRVTPPNLSPFEIADAPAVLRPLPDGGSLLDLEIGDGRREVVIPRALGGLGATEIGDLVALRGGQPALQIGWFGSQVLLVFTDRATRDTAAAVVRRDG